MLININYGLIVVLVVCRWWLDVVYDQKNVQHLRIGYYLFLVFSHWISQKSQRTNESRRVLTRHVVLIPVNNLWNNRIQPARSPGALPFEISVQYCHVWQTRLSTIQHPTTSLHSEALTVHNNTKFLMMAHHTLILIWIQCCELRPSLCVKQRGFKLYACFMAALSMYYMYAHADRKTQRPAYTSTTGSTSTGT
jgi:hypothetical protein